MKTKINHIYTVTDNMKTGFDNSKTAATIHRPQQLPLWRTEDALVLWLRGWRLSSRTWNLTTCPWMKQSTWLRIVHSGDWCLQFALHTPIGACQTRRSTHTISSLFPFLFMTRVDYKQWWRNIAQNTPWAGSPVTRFGCTRTGATGRSG